MKYILILIWIVSSQISEAQILDTIIFKVNEGNFLKKKSLVEPYVDGYKVSLKLHHYFKKSVANAYYIFKYQRGDIVFFSCEGMVIDGKFEGLWMEKNHTGNVNMTYEFLNNKFDGEQVFYDGNKVILKVHCKKNKIEEIETFDAKGDLSEIRTYSKGKLISKKVIGISPEFNIRKN